MLDKVAAASAASKAVLGMLKKRPECWARSALGIHKSYVHVERSTYVREKASWFKLKLVIDIYTFTAFTVPQAG